MLKHLRIQNIILVEEADIPFYPGFNILTGETGSGKSAIMHGLALVMGERTDTSLIRKGNEKAAIEAVFDISKIDLLPILEQGGIEHPEEQDLIIRREISHNGKNRIFINNQAAQLSFLKQLGQQLIQIVGQHDNQRLFSLDFHRDIVDVYGDLSQPRDAFRQSYDEENKLKSELERLIQEEAFRLRECGRLEAELEELEEAKLTPGEDETLFAEYSLLANAEEIAQKVEEVNQGLNGEKYSVIAQLNRSKGLLESLASLDPSLQETCEAFNNAYIELQEISRTLAQYGSRLHFDPRRFAWINDRLALLTKIKRKYGQTIDEVMAYQQQAQDKLQRHLQADEQIESLREELKQREKMTDGLAGRLTEQRLAQARRLATDLTAQLNQLNMPKAEFIVSVSPQKRSSHGDDKVEFFLRPNVGEHQIALKDGASGGEISRVLLSLQTLLAGKEQIGALIFDEVDANIGGETATIVGDKLKEISHKHQVICITHFPQVASKASHHLQISKSESEGRTTTRVKQLDSQEQQRELSRMAGNGR